MILDRPKEADRLCKALDAAPVVLLTGPRQAGKSTLARQVVDVPRSNYFDLEDPRDLARLGEPTLVLPQLEGTVVIDEAQVLPDLFPVLRVLVDEDRRPGRFLVLGSASPELVGLASESLAGRVTLLELGGFRYSDVDGGGMDKLWLRGALPEAYLAESNEDSNRWRDDYISTFLERDLALLGFRQPATTMRRFWSMLAHYHGQTWNGAEFARSMGVSQPTIRRYLDALTDALVVRQLSPWFANLSKRQVKAPKVYVRDSGLLHRLLGIGDETDLLRHPKAGASWEGMIIEQLLASTGGSSTFWSTHAGAELDLRLEVGGRVVGVEVKRTDRPRTTKSMHVALEDLELDHLYVVHGGQHDFPMTDQITAMAASTALMGGDGVFQQFL